MLQKKNYKSIQNFRISKRLVLFGVFLFLLAMPIFSGVLSHPRKMNVISTKYFDIIFSAESEETAKTLSENADELYLKAKKLVGAKNEIRIVVVISPDSEKFSATYSPSPYNRIVIYDGIPTDEYFNYDNILIDSFYHEVLRAVGYSIRSPGIDKFARIIRSYGLRPSYIINLPFSFIEGVTSLEYEDENILNDNYNIQRLMQAKIENKFPTWVEAAGTRDIYPDNELSRIAGIAFAAYLQQRFGLEKYSEFWEASGRFYVISFVQGIFHKVYGEEIEVVWNDFVAAIPTPDFFESDELDNLNVTPVFENERSKLYSNLISTSYGLVWYDDMSHEVVLYNPDATSKMRRLLFYAENVTKLSADETGRFVSVSLKQNKKRSNLQNYKTLIYDLKSRVFLPEEYYLDDACIVKTKSGFYAVAGINKQNKNPRISVQLSKNMNADFSEFFADLVYEENTEFFSRSFENNYYPFSLSRGEAGAVASLMNHNGETFFYYLDFDSESDSNDSAENFENLFPLSSFGFGKGIANLQLFCNYENPELEDSIYTFQFFPKDEFSFAKVGMILFDCEVSDILLLTDDVSGGVYSPVLVGNEIYFYSKKSEFSVLQKTDGLHFAQLSVSDFKAEKFSDEGKAEVVYTNEDYKKYNPLKYVFRGSLKPFFPIRDLSVVDGVEIWPGLGASYSTRSDPLGNNELVFSASAGFAKLDFINIINPTADSLEKLKAETSLFNNVFSGSAYFVNTTTPVTFALGGIIKFKSDGQYNLKAIGGVNWTLPLGMKFKKIDFTIESSYTCSTEYNDIYVSEEKPDLFDWPSLSDSYITFDVYASVKYSNMQQAGISPYEQRGLEALLKIYSTWDYTEMQGRESNQFNIYTGTYNPSLISFSFFSKFCVPRINPLQNYDGWILGVPSTFSVAILKDKGTAFSASSKILLIGKEVQKGIPFTPFYFSRFGLSLGYDLDFDYAIKQNLLPDICSYNQFIQVFKNIILNDKIYLDFDFSLASIIGNASHVGASGDFKIVYGIQTNEMILSFDMKFRL